MVPDHAQPGCVPEVANLLHSPRVCPKAGLCLSLKPMPRLWWGLNTHMLAKGLYESLFQGEYSKLLVNITHASLLVRFV